MKILLTTHQFLPDYTSGTEVLTFEVAREFMRLGHDVRIFTGWPVGTSDAVTQDVYSYEGVCVHRVFPPSQDATTIAQRTRDEFDNPDVVTVLAELVATWRPDVVHFFHLHRLSASIVSYCASAGIANVYTATDFWAICPLSQLRLPDGGTCAGPEPDTSNCVLHLALHGRRIRFAPMYRWIPNGVVGALLRYAPETEDGGPINLAAARALQQRPAHLQAMLRAIDRIIVPTSFLASALRDFGAPARTITQLAYGIDTSVYDDMPAAGVDPVLRIGFIGTLSAHKGAHVLVAATRLLDRRLACAVRIFGDESTSPDYVAGLREAAGHDTRITFEGPFARSELRARLETVDVLVVPSTWSENTPLVIYAAQCARRPVVGSDVAGIAEVVDHGVNGLLFEAGNAASLAACLERLIDDRSQLRVLAANARPPKDVSQYAAEVLEVYHDVLDARIAGGLDARKLSA